MKDYIITVDTGTTNTRTILWDSGRNIVATENRNIGVRNTAIDGHNSQLKQAVKNCLDTLLEKAGIGYENIRYIIASGMITSNVGLYEIPHLVVPVGIEDLAAATTSVLLEDICPLPIHFIPGVKNYGGTISLENLERMDIMRGEEVESCVIIDRFQEGKPLLLVLPGSHTKFVAVGADGRISGCLTTITGELIASITNNTILADAVNRSFVSEDTYDKEMLLLGYDTAKKTGLGRTCFSGRILSQFVTKDSAKIANFILGAALQNDITAIKNSDAVRADENTDIIVGGKNPLRQAFVDIFNHEALFGSVRNFVSEQEIPLSALGAYLIAEKASFFKAQE